MSSPGAAAALAAYACSDRTNRYHLAQIRRHLGSRECSVEDADKLTAWFAREVCGRERRPDVVRRELLGRCRLERIGHRVSAGWSEIWVVGADRWRDPPPAGRAKRDR